MNDHIRQAMTERLEAGQLPCKQAFAIVHILKVDPLAVGLEANEAGIRISRCQLGLFGYGPKAEGRHKIVRPAADIADSLARRLRQCATAGGITCASLWQAADGLGIPRLDAAGAAEALGLKVSHCQLGCFPRPASSLGAQDPQAAKG